MEGLRSHQSHESHGSHSWPRPPYAPCPQTPSVAYLSSVIRSELQASSALTHLATAGSKLLPDRRDQKTVLSANHFCSKITGTTNGLGMVTEGKRDFEADAISVLLVRDIDQRRT